MTLPTRFLLATGCRTATLAAILLVSFVSGGAQPTASAPASPTSDQAAEYVGSEICRVCHEDIYKDFQKNPHHAVESDKKLSFENRACESCHGPAAKHAESVSATDIRLPAKLAPAEADRICLSCHQNQPTHIGRINSRHAKNQVSCVNCRGPLRVPGVSRQSAHSRAGMGNSLNRMAVAGKSAT